MKEGPMTELDTWRAHGIGAVRIAFGMVWAIDAQFKWRSDFIHNFVGYLTGALSHQPPLVRHWIGLWINVVKVDPTAVAYVVAISETALAVALIFGIFTDLACLGGALLCLVIWSTAEGLGGPYVAGSTDIGTAIIYVFVFGLLFLTRAGLYHGYDRRLAGKLGSLSWLASGPADQPAA
jgi:thiosulfate dehydrogenase [quinone] large subunit